MKKGLIIILVFMIAITSSSCWSRRELNTIGIVTALGIDKAEEEGKILVSLQIIKPSEIKSSAGGPGGSSKGVWIAKSTGYTVFDAIRNATMITERKVFLSQNMVVIIGEDLAKMGVSPLLDVLDRDPEPRRLAWFLIAQGRAEDVIESEHEQEKIPAEAIEGLIKSSKFSSMGVQINMHEFLKMLAYPTTDPYATRIQVFKEPSKDPKESKPINRMRITGASVFKKDKLVGWLNRPETRGLNWIRGKVDSGIIVVKSPEDETKNIALEIIRANSKIVPEIRDGQIIMNVEVKEEGNFAEQMSPGLFLTPEMFKVLEKRKAAVIKNEIESVLKKAQQEWGVDIFGFGEILHRKYPKEWERLKDRWEEEFPQVQVNLKIITKLRVGGLTSRPTTQ